MRSHPTSVGQHFSLPVSVVPPQEFSSEDPLDLVNLKTLMQISSGRAQTIIGLIDGPVNTSHEDLSGANVRELPGNLRGGCSRSDSFACMHGTFVAGVLIANRQSHAPAICPGCTLLVRAIFTETSTIERQMPSATADELCSALVDCVNAGAHVINLSAALSQPSAKSESHLEEALDYCAKRGVIVVAAAGNQGTVGSSAITRHPWCIPVGACDLRGRPIGYSNLGNSIGRRGLSAPGVGVKSVNTAGNVPTFGGTSAAAPFVTGTIALLRSIFPAASSSNLKWSLTARRPATRPSIVPPLLDAWASYKRLLDLSGR